MHLMYFTEQPMSAYSEQAGREFGATALMFPNTHFDPAEGSRLYNDYIEQYQLAEAVGVDGIMLNEHHNAPFCMQAKCNVFASILAAMTKRVKLVLLGNPLPLADNPVRLAEELAMIDMVSRGRLVSFDLVGTGRKQRWPWVRPETGMLVWDPERRGRITSGTQLFGNFTWSIFWRNGYEPLAFLDDNHDGWLRGPELQGLSVWQDRNGNGVSEPGEVAPVAALGIARIAVQTSSASSGVPFSRRGVARQDGTCLPTYDWTPVSRYAEVARWR